MRSATRSKTGKDPAYLEWIRQQPCAVCGGAGESYRLVVEAAHVGQRGISQKCPDRESIPLCRHHHRTGLWSHHVLGKHFWSHWGLDRDALIREHVARYEKECLLIGRSESDAEGRILTEAKA